MVRSIEKAPVARFTLPLPVNVPAALANVPAPPFTGPFTEYVKLVPVSGPAPVKETSITSPEELARVATPFVYLMLWLLLAEYDTLPSNVDEPITFPEELNVVFPFVSDVGLTTP
jgi:hypothetical protein